MWATVSYIFAQTGVDTFWGTSLGGFLKAILAATGVLVVIMVMVKAIGNASRGRVGESVKNIVFGVVIAAFLFRPELFTAVLNLATTIVDYVVTAISEVGGSGAGQAPPS